MKTLFLLLISTVVACGQANTGPLAANLTGATNFPAVVNGGVASAGQVGEVISSAVASGASKVLTTATGTNVTFITLTAGDWDVSGNISFSGVTATITGLSAGINTTTLTVPTDGTEVYSGVAVTLLSLTESITIPRKVVNVSGSTAVYLVAKSTFTAGTVSGFGSLTARRVR